LNRFYRKIIIGLGLVTCCSFYQGIVEADSPIKYQWNQEPAQSQPFPEPYSLIEGVLTFRGSSQRSAPAYGTVDMKRYKPTIAWEKKTRTSSWGGGAGWTGQPVIIRWKPEVVKTMNVKPQFRDKPQFTEVIYGSLDGYVYFLDLETGEETRNPIRVGNPIKGSVSVDSRGYPLLYVGEGVPENGTIGFHLYSLTNEKELLFVKGIDSFSYRKWGAFDGSALFNRNDDTLLVGGENGILYQVKLNTDFKPELKSISIRPIVYKYRYAIKGNGYQGIENSVSVYDDLVFFADNGGSIQAMNLKSHVPQWSLPATDDTDATIVIEEETGNPYLYTGTEVDKQGTKGKALIRKINGRSGEVVWQMTYPCFSLLGDHPVNGGLLATPVLGKKEIGKLVIFTIARYGTFSGGLMVALDKATGKEIWKLPMKSYSWSSPVDVYDQKGRGYLIQADSVGNIFVINALDGKVQGSLSIGSNIEASPAIYNNYVVVASRNGRIYGFKLE
jgi:outer membrane protein assembly factor BamB